MSGRWSGGCSRRRRRVADLGPVQSSTSSGPSTSRSALADTSSGPVLRGTPVAFEAFDVAVQAVAVEVLAGGPAFVLLCPVCQADCGHFGRYPDASHCGWRGWG